MSLPLMGESFAFGAAICWAVGPLIAYRGVEALGTIRFSLLRFVISALILWALALGAGSIDFSDTRALLLLAVSGVVGIALGEVVLFQAVYFLGPRIASIIFSLHAPITAFVGAAIFHETMTPLTIVGVSLAIIGVYAAIIYRSSSEKLGGEWHKIGKTGKGLILAVAAVIFQVIGALLSKEGVTDVDPFFASLVRTASAAVAFMPIFIFLRERDRTPKPADLRFVLYSAAVSTVGGMTFLLAAFAYTEIFRAVVIASLAPVLYILIMSIVRRERFPIGAWLGTILAVSGVILTVANT